MIRKVSFDFFPGSIPVIIFLLPFLVKIKRRSKTNPAMRTTKQITPMIEYTNAPFAAPD